MLKTIKQDNIYEVRVESNNKLIGHFIPEVDGSYYFAPYESNGGLWSEFALLAIGNKLKSINNGIDV